MSAAAINSAVTDRLVSGRAAQGRRHARGGRASPGAGVFCGIDDCRGRPAPAAGGRDGESSCGGVPVAGLSRHGLQLFGAMGFTWENDLQFALKRAKAGELHARRSRRTSGDDHRGVPCSSLLIVTSKRSARNSLRSLTSTLPAAAAKRLERPRSVSHMPAVGARWQRLLFDNGWLLPSQPPEFGGRNATVLQQYRAIWRSCADGGFTTVSIRRA